MSEPSAATIPGGEEALILEGGSSSPANSRIAALLAFFGVPSRTAKAAEFLTRLGHGEKTLAKLRLFCSADVFVELLFELERRSDGWRDWNQQVHSVFVYSSDHAPAYLDLVRTLSGDHCAAFQDGNADGTQISVLNDADLCGAMAGISIDLNARCPASAVTFQGDQPLVVHLLSTGRAAVFLKVNYRGVPVFCSGSKEIIDLGAHLPSGVFDIREQLLQSLPIVLYIRWAFPTSCWTPAEINACLVIDDPLLRPTHGFVNYDELLRLMKRHTFSTNVAFIPWNRRRSKPEIVRLFDGHPDQLSLSVHGCDHIRAEFGNPDEKTLYAKAIRGLKWMEQHESETGLHHDRVMVFPQGVFSEVAMSAIKRTELIAAVNNDTISADPIPRPVTVADVWDIAVMKYSDFPLFTRRYPWEGIENFAFDALLGKPAISIIHHDYLCDHGERLVRFVDRLNAVKCRITWRSLGEVVRRSCRMRKVSADLTEVEMYASELRLENGSDEVSRFTVKKHELAANSIREVQAGSRSLPWRVRDRMVEFDIDLEPHESTLIQISFHPLEGIAREQENLSHKAQTMLRRYLCEIRDNYVAKGRFVFTSLLKGHQ